MFVQECSKCVMIKNLPNYLSTEQELTQQLHHYFNLTPTFTWIQNNNAIVHFDKNINMAKLIVDKLPVDPIIKNSATEPQKIIESTRTQAPLSNVISVVPSPPKKHACSCIDEPTVMIQNHSEIAFGDIAMALGKKLNVRIGKLYKNPHYPGFIIVPLQEQYVSLALKIGHLQLVGSKKSSVRVCI